MKIRHKVPSAALRSKPEPISERYAAEIARSLRRAEKAWRRAERRAAKVRQRLEQSPCQSSGPDLHAIVAEAERLRAEFEELRRLMQQAPVSSSHSGAGQVRHRTGRDDHLEQGVHKRKRAPKTRVRRSP